MNLNRFGVSTGRNTLHEKIFRILLVLSLFLVPIASLDFGITTDEDVGSQHGYFAVSFYTSFFQDKTCLTYSNLRWYGALYEMSCVLFHTLFPFVEKFEARHIVNSLYFWLIIFFGGLTARRHFGSLAGVLTVLMLLFSPRLFGHGMNNPKDIPFTSFYTAAIYFLSLLPLEFPYVRFRTLAGIVASIALAINIRVGGLMLICFAIPLTLILFCASFRSMDRNQILKTAAIFFGAAAAAYLGGSLFWPYVLCDPIFRPIEVLRAISDFPLVTPELFMGKIHLSDELPRTYLPVWFLVTTPFVVLFGIPLGLLPRRRMNLNLILYGILSAGVVPLIYVIYKQSTLYDTFRHLLFVYPFFVITAAAGWTRLFETIREYRYVHGAAAILLFGLFLDPVCFSVRNHPNQVTYFNGFVGGLPGAFGRYDVDCLANSHKQAVEWLYEVGRFNGMRLKYSSRFHIHYNRETVELYPEAYPEWAPESIFTITQIRGTPEKLSELVSYDDIVHRVEVDGITICTVRLTSPGYEMDGKRLVRVQDD